MVIVELLNSDVPKHNYYIQIYVYNAKNILDILDSYADFGLLWFGELAG